MLSSEALNDITEEPNSEWDDEAYFDEEDDFDQLQMGDENDQKGVVDLTALNQSSRPTTTKSMGSSFRSEGKRIRLKHQRPPMYSFGGGTTLKRDPVIESIIDSRQFSVIENSYTRLAQVSSQAPRISQRTNQFEIRPSTTAHREIKSGILSSQSEKRIISSKASEPDSEGWDDGSTAEYEKDPTPSIDKTCVRLYEETCKRLSICPCSMIVRSLNTTMINLGNYGLGPRGCAALAVGLVRNTTVLSLNLSGNNIGSNGMSHVYQILTENAYIEDYDLSFNNLGTKGITKLADAILKCVPIQTLNVAGNELTGNDIKILLSKLEDHPNLNNLNISHNQLDEEGGTYVGEWLGDNNILLYLDVSWCSIRLSGAKAIAKTIGDNNKLISIDLSHNSFTNDTVEVLINSLSRNMTLCELNLRGNQLISRYDVTVKDNPSVLITGKDSQIYKMIAAAAINQSLKILRLGRNHIDARCLMIMLESLSKLDNITLEELDLTGLTITANQISKIDLLFTNHSKLVCYVGPVRQAIEHFVNNLLNLIITYCQVNDMSLSDMFNPNEGYSPTASIVTYDKFLDGLRRAKIPFPTALIDDIMKYLGRDNEQGFISLRSLITAK